MSILLNASILTVSCTKESNKSFLSGGTPNNGPVPEVGSIADLGEIDPGIRLMTVALSTHSFSLIGNDGEQMGTSAKVNVSFYTNSDALIPSGDYSYSSSGVLAPSTFDSRVIMDLPNSDGNTVTSDVIVGGVINVSQGESTYNFNFQVELASGKTFVGSYNGIMKYSDNY